MTRIVTIAAAAIAAFGLSGIAAAGGLASDITPRSEYVGVNAERILDTRSSGPVDGEIVVDAAALVGATGHEADALGVTAVIVNITAVDAASPIYVTAWGDGPRPNASVLNITGAGDIDSNEVTIPVVDGTFRLYTSGPANVLVDLMGAYLAAS